MAVLPESSLTAHRSLGLQAGPSAKGLFERIPLLDEERRKSPDVGELFAPDVRRRVDEIRQALADDVDADARAAVDLLNASAKKVGALRLGFLGIRLSTALRSNDPGAARAVFELLAATADLTVAALEAPH